MPPQRSKLIRNTNNIELSSSEQGRPIRNKKFSSAKEAHLLRFSFEYHLFMQKQEASLDGHMIGIRAVFNTLRLELFAQTSHNVAS